MGFVGDGAASLVFGTLEPPELGFICTSFILPSGISEFLEAVVVGTAVAGSSEAPNLKIGPAIVEGFAANPKMLPPEVSGVLMPVATRFGVLVVELNMRPLPVDVSLTKAETATVDTGEELETFGSLANVKVSDLLLISPALGKLGWPDFSNSDPFA